MDEEKKEPDEDHYVDDQLKKKNVELYITLLRTFGIISVTIPTFLLFINEFVWDNTIISLIAGGIIILLATGLWSRIVRKSNDKEMI